MKTLNDCENIAQIKEALTIIIERVERQQKDMNFKPEILFANLYHELDCFLNYERSDGRKKD